MSWTLGIDTSSVDMGIGLYKGDTPVAAYSRYVINSHAEHIAQTVSHILKVNNITPAEIPHIATTTGPGSFTGLRIGIAFTKGLAISNDTKIFPVSSLKILAHGARHTNGKVIAAIDARNGDIFWATFQFTNGIISRITDDCCSPVDNFSRALSDDCAIVYDKMGYAKSSSFNFLEHRPNVFNIEKFPIQRGLFCAALGAANINSSDAWINQTDLHPHYLRSSAARIPGTRG